MKQRIILFGSILFFLSGAALIYLAPAFSTPNFVILNTTKDKITVIAKWRDNRKTLGILLAGEKTEFKVSDEASMEIIALFPNSSSISSTSVYFTSGMSYSFTVSNDKIEAHLK